MPDTDFRSYPTATGQVYEIDGVPVSKAEFDTRAAASKQAVQNFRTAKTEGAEDLEDMAAAARARILKKPVPKKHGGSMKMGKSKISTHQKSKKASSW